MCGEPRTMFFFFPLSRSVFVLLHISFGTLSVFRFVPYIYVHRTSLTFPIPILAHGENSNGRLFFKYYIHREIPMDCTRKRKINLEREKLPEVDPNRFHLCPAHGAFWPFDWPSSGMEAVRQILSMWLNISRSITKYRCHFQIRLFV